MILKTDLYLTSDRSLVVTEGDKRAAFLLGRAGQDIPEKLARKYGLIGEVQEASTIPVEVKDPNPQNREVTITRKRRKRTEFE
jgi:hypothetical protein